MQPGVRVNFGNKALPSLSQIETQVRQRTGLTCEVTQPAKGCNGSSIRFLEGRRVEVVWLDQAVIVCYNRRLGYFEWCVVATLVELGGEWTGGPIPEYANAPWTDHHVESPSLLRWLGRRFGHRG